MRQHANVNAMRLGTPVKHLLLWTRCLAQSHKGLRLQRLRLQHCCGAAAGQAISSNQLIGIQHAQPCVAEASLLGHSE